MSELAEVPYPPDTRARGWRFELDMEKVQASDTWLRARTGAMRGALLLLWSQAWQQTPCGSLPADHELLALMLDMDGAEFEAGAAILLHGWSLAADGRLYHRTITDRVLAMLATRSTDRTRAEARRTMFERVLERDGKACVYCGHTKYLTLDHLLPLSRGGTNDEGNLAIACRPCNSKKRDRTPDEASMPFVSEAMADRWKQYKKSAGEKRSDAEARGETRSDPEAREETRRNDTRTRTRTSINTTPPATPVPPAVAGSSDPPPSTPVPKAARLIDRDELIAEGLPADIATAWLDHRRAKKAKLTQLAWWGFKAEAGKAGWTLEDAVRKAIARNWTSFEAAWVAADGAGRSRAPTETAYQRSMREKAEIISPAIAVRSPVALQSFEGVSNVVAIGLG